MKCRSGHERPKRVGWDLARRNQAPKGSLTEKATGWRPFSKNISIHICCLQTKYCWSGTYGRFIDPWVQANHPTIVCNPGLKPGLVEKFAAAKTGPEKWYPQGLSCKRHEIINAHDLSRFELLKLFIMDPTLQNVEVEAFFMQQGPQIVQIQRCVLKPNVYIEHIG